MRAPHVAAIAVAVLALPACNHARPLEAPPGSTLEFDASMLYAIDVGPGHDAGPGHDSGGLGVDGGSDAGHDAGHDAAGPCVLYVPSGTFALTSSCLPRCSAATATSYHACTNSTCRTNAATADRTPGVSYSIGSVHITTPLDCVACVAYQEYHCINMICPSQVDAYVRECIAGAGGTTCDNAISLVHLCVNGSSSANLAILDSCYASRDGIEGCFP